jgi:hypothetical protein
MRLRGTESARMGCIIVYWIGGAAMTLLICDRVVSPARLLFSYSRFTIIVQLKPEHDGGMNVE